MLSPYPVGRTSGRTKGTIHIISLKTIAAWNIMFTRWVIRNQCPEPYCKSKLDSKWVPSVPMVRAPGSLRPSGKDYFDSLLLTQLSAFNWSSPVSGKRIRQGFFVKRSVISLIFPRIWHRVWNRLYWLIKTARVLNPQVRPAGEPRGTCRLFRFLRT